MGGAICPGICNAVNQQVFVSRLCGRMTDCLRVSDDQSAVPLLDGLISSICSAVISAKCGTTCELPEHQSSHANALCVAQAEEIYANTPLAAWLRRSASGQDRH